MEFLNSGTSRAATRIGGWVGLAAALILGVVQPASAGILLSEDFESGVFNPSRWATNISGAIVADPLASGHGLVLHFTASGSGGDLFSQLMPYDDPVALDFDFLQVGNVNSQAYVGTDHQTVPYGVEQWILNTGGGGAYSNLDFPPADTWTHIHLVFNVYDPGGAGAFALKLEQGFSGALGAAYFDNISVATPEPGSMACLVLGFGLLAVLRRRRASSRAATLPPSSDGR